MDPQPSVTSMPSVSSRVMSGHTNSVAFSDFDYASPRSPAPAPTPKRMTQFSHASESQPDSSTRLMAIQQTQDQLSFFQRYFTKPVDQPTGSKSEWRHRRFSFSARGTLVAAAVLLLLLIAIIAAATATSVHHHHHQQEGQGAAGGNNASKSNSSAGGGGSPNAGSSPIRLAIQANFPDPSLRFVNDTWYAYATNNAAGIINATSHAYDNTEYGQSNVQLATSTDFVNWTIQPATEDPLPLTGTWVVQGSTAPNGLVPAVPNAAVWATSVLLRKTDGKFVLYYAARSSGPSIRSDGSKSHCIGAAVSETESPAGPYIPLNESLVCPYTQGGAIDPYGFVGRAGTPWLLYKVDGNSIGAGGPCSNMEAPQKPTPIMLQKMQSDGITLDGEPIQLLDRTDADGPLVSQPSTHFTI